MRVHLLDGTYELFRMFYGAPSATGVGGGEVGATRGLLRSLAALLADDGVTHVGVAFDHVIESFRNALFDGYKTGAGIDPDLRAQFPLAERAAAALGLVVWPMVEFEADDALATMAARLAEDGRVEQVVIGSPDKDLCQCVRGRDVVLWDRRRDLVLDEPAVVAKHGVEPASIPDLLALVGDSADGIPGIPRWGAKSAAAVLARYGHVRDIPDGEAEWDVKVRGAKTLAANLRERRDDAELYVRLATLRTDVPLEEDLDALEWRGADRAALEDLCAELGETALLDRIPRWR
jgi:5'-3' exonuclease